MSITVIKHGKKGAEQARQLGDALRNSQIGQAKGALLLSTNSADADPIHLLEKIINGDQFVPGTPAEEVNWKEGATVVCVDGSEKQLAALAAICPGFLTHFGPVAELALA